MRNTVAKGLSIAIWSLVLGLGSAGAASSSRGWHGDGYGDLLAGSVEEQTADALETAVAELRARVDSLAERGGERAQLSALYRDLLSKVGWLAQVRFYERQQQAAEASDASTEDEARLYERYRAEVTAATLAVADEWVARLPDDLEAHLARLDLETDPERNSTRLEEIIDRFPDRVEPVERRANALSWRGEERQGIDLLQRFADDHPDSPAAHRALMELHAAVGDSRSAAEVERVWIERFPRDSEVLLHRLESLVEEASGKGPNDPARRAELESLAEELLAADLGLEELAGVCNVLVDDLPARAAACVDEFERRDGEGRYADWVRAQRANLAAAAGDLTSFEATLVGLPAEQALQSRLGMAARRAGEGDCEAALRLLEPVAADSSSGSGERAMLLQALAECGAASRAAAVAEALLSEAAADELRGYVYFLERYVAADLVETRLLERLAAEPESTPLHQTLQYVYSQGDDTGRAFAHLLTWAALDRESAEPLAKLSRAFAERGRFAEAIEQRREAALREPLDVSHQRALFDLFLAAEEPAAARSLAEGLRGSPRREESLQGLELLARLATSEGRGEDALALYETYLGEAESDVSRSVRRAYLTALRDAGRRDEVVAHLERLFEEKREQRTYTSREAYLASELNELDMPETALPFLRSVLERAPRNPQRHLETGETLAALGRLDEAARHYLRAAELAPDDVHAATSVAEFLLGRERFAEAADLLQPVAGEPAEYAEPSILLGRAYRGLGRLDEAIEVLVTVLDASPDEHQAELELARVYEAKGVDAEALRRFQAFVDATEKYVAKADSNCACYCEIVQTRSEIVALLAERQTGAPSDSAPAAAAASRGAVPARPQG